MALDANVIDKETVGLTLLEVGEGVLIAMTVAGEPGKNVGVPLILSGIVDTIGSGATIEGEITTIGGVRDSLEVLGVVIRWIDVANTRLPGVDCVELQLLPTSTNMTNVVKITNPPIVFFIDLYLFFRTDPLIFP